ESTRPRRARPRAAANGRRRSRCPPRSASSWTRAGPSTGSAAAAPAHVRPLTFGRSCVEPRHEHPHVPGPSIWPVGFAVGVVALLVGFVVNWAIVVVGALIAAAFGFLWVRDLARRRGLTKAPAVEPERR